MSIRAKGPAWHKKYKKKGIIPKGLRGIDKEATWGFSKLKGWIYGHGTFSLTSYKIPIVGIFQWMQNSAHEVKRMEKEVIKYTRFIKKVFMDSKADDQKIYFKLKRENNVQLLTPPRKGKDKSESRRRMIKEMWTKSNRKQFRKRSITVEPMQGLIKDIFELERCWMRGDENNRWIFAAMGTAVQMAQWKAYQEKRSTWDIKSDVLGV